MDWKRVTFPHKVTQDSVTVTIYREKRGPYQTFRVRWKCAGAKQEESKNNFAKAYARAKEITMNLAAGKLQNAPNFTAYEWELYQELKQKVFQKTGLSLTTAVNQFLDKWEPDTKDMLIEDAFAAYKAAKEKKKIGRRHMDDIKQRIGALAKKFPKRLMSSLKKDEVVSWIEGISTAIRTQENYLDTVRGFLNWCVKVKILPQREPHILKDVELAKDKSPAKDMLMPHEDLRQLLRLIYKRDDADELFLTIGLQAWGGVRDAEFQRLTWGNIKFDGDELVSVFVNEKQAKTPSRRSIQLNESIKMLFALVKRKESGPLTSYVYAKRCISKLAKKHGIKWLDNCLRHSFITHALSICGDSSKVAIWAGNSPRMIDSTYKGLSTPTEAKAWFDSANMLKWFKHLRNVGFASDAKTKDGIKITVELSGEDEKNETSLSKSNAVDTLYELHRKKHQHQEVLKLLQKEAKAEGFSDIGEALKASGVPIDEKKSNEDWVGFLKRIWGLEPPSPQ